MCYREMFLNTVNKKFPLDPNGERPEGKNRHFSEIKWRHTSDRLTFQKGQMSVKTECQRDSFHLYGIVHL